MLIQIIGSQPPPSHVDTNSNMLSSSASIPSVIQGSGNEGTKCPVCDEVVTFIAPHADRLCRFENMTDDEMQAHDEHCAQNHPNEPVWNTIPKRQNVTIDSVEGFMQHNLEYSALLLNFNPVSDTTWEHTRAHVYGRLAVARSFTNDPLNKLVVKPDFLCGQRFSEWKDWIIHSTRTFLTSLMDNIKTSPQPQWWKALTVSRIENLIQICFRKDGAYATCGLFDSSRIPTVPQWDATNVLPWKRKRKL
jgi:hypothetical protein